MSSDVNNYICLGLSELRNDWSAEFVCESGSYQLECSIVSLDLVQVGGNSIVFNSLAPGGFENIFQNVFFKLISWIDTLSNSCETALRSMPQNPSDDKSTLVQVMAWCRQAASHYLSQCCPKSLSPYGVTRPQWVKQWSCRSLVLSNQSIDIPEWARTELGLSWCSQHRSGSGPVLAN